MQVRADLNLIVHDTARTLHKTMHAMPFHNRYLEVLRKTIFAIIRRQRERGVPADATSLFLSHFLRLPREAVDWQLTCLDPEAAQATA